MSIEVGDDQPTVRCTTEQTTLVCQVTHGTAGHQLHQHQQQHHIGNKTSKPSPDISLILYSLLLLLLLRVLRVRAACCCWCADVRSSARWQNAKCDIYYILWKFCAIWLDPSSSPQRCEHLTAAVGQAIQRCTTLHCQGKLLHMWSLGWPVGRLFGLLLDYG